MEVGGAYAHIFFHLLDFLNLKTLIITDIDTVDKKVDGKKCKVSLGTHSSNACINSWFAGTGIEEPTKDELLQKTDTQKTTKNRRLAFQVPHIAGDACGRSLEEAFMLANAEKFGIAGGTIEEREARVEDSIQNRKKTAFAIKHAIDDTNWITPRYIVEGLQWLAAPHVVVKPVEGTAPATMVVEERANA